MTESECIAVSQEMRNVFIFPVIFEIIFLYLQFNINIPNPERFCKVFQNNQTCISVDQSNKFLPPKKNISIKYQYFRFFLQKNFIRI